MGTQLRTIYAPAAAAAAACQFYFGYCQAARSPQPRMTLRQGSVQGCTKRSKAWGYCARSSLVTNPPMECDTMFTRAPPFASLMASNLWSSNFECDLLLCLHRASIFAASMLSERQFKCTG